MSIDTIKIKKFYIVVLKEILYWKTRCKL